VILGTTKRQRYYWLNFFWMFKPENMVIGLGEIFWDPPFDFGQ
jgi:hypothetical protein